VDILAHPGLITEAEVRLAAQKGVVLELTTRRGHSLSNGHVARLALQCGAQLVIDTDSHSPDDLTPWAQAERIARGAGLDEVQVAVAHANSERLLKRLTF
ncbi:MAG: histidinol phosphate phosphatase domain-containing protein, partial [Deltaproteobacteria bacterium]|nr:histidinol phosphate phosphatase domain-containing protein [Deltaproteobacteria bacterium]